MSESRPPTDQHTAPSMTDDEETQAVVAAKAIIEGATDTNEALLSHEAVVAVINNSVYDTRCHIKSKERYGGNVSVDSMRVRPVGEKLAGEFLDQGILEKVAIEASKGIPFSRVKPGSEHGDESIVMLAYSTLNRGGNYMKNRGRHYNYTNSMGGAGNVFQYNLFLPQSVADDILARARTEPRIMRQLGDEIMMREYSQDEWNKVRPPFDNWREINDGVERLAIVEGLDGRPEEAKVIEF